MNNKGTTYAEQIEAIIVELLSDCRNHERGEILFTVRDTMKVIVSDSTIQNTISALIRKGKCVRVNRGIYSSVK